MRMPQVRAVPAAPAAVPAAAGLRNAGLALQRCCLQFICTRQLAHTHAERPCPHLTSCAVHAALNDPASGYPAAEVAEAVRHTPAQVRTLLGVV